MEWSGMTSPDDVKSYEQNKSNPDAQLLIDDCIADFKAHITGKTAVTFEIEPTIIEFEGTFGLTAKYKVW